MSTFARRASLMAQHHLQSGCDAAATIAARTPGLIAGGAVNAREATLMVTEKVAAAYEGALCASLAWGAFLFESALRGGATPAQLSHALFDVAEAAAAPAQRTVGANAKRLSPGSKTR